MKKTLTLALAATLLCGSAALAGTFKRTVELRPPAGTDLGDTISRADLGGLATIESRPSFHGGSETLAVRVFSNAKDGMKYSVHVKCEKGLFAMGSVTMLLGSGALKVADPPMPVRTIETITVRNGRGAVILRGSFPRFTTN